jgi:hypothetical protein
MSKSFNFVEYYPRGKGRPRGGLNDTELLLRPPLRSTGKGALLRIPLLVLRNLGAPKRVRILYDAGNKAFSIRPESDPSLGYSVTYTTKGGKNMTTFSVEMTRFNADDEGLPYGTYKAIMPDVFEFDTPLAIEHEEHD